METNLVIFAFALFALEVLTPLPTFGVAGVFSLAVFALSGALQSNPQIWGPLFVLMTLIVLYFVWQAVKSFKIKGPAQGLEAFVDKTTTIVSVDGKKKARVKVLGELWTVTFDPSVPEATCFEVGQNVKILRQQDLSLIVVPQNPRT